MSGKMRATLLHDWHVENGANMAAFGAYDMPLWYPDGAKGEHLAVINSAGLFDTSHMAVVLVEGADSRALLQRCFSKDLEKCIGMSKGPLVSGRSAYGLFLTPNGHVLDDSIVSQVTDRFYMVVVNAGMGKAVSEYLATYQETLEADITDLTDKVGKIDIQGKNSARVLSRVLTDPANVFSSFPYFSFKGWYDDSLTVPGVTLTDGTPVLLSRTGYTGEFGFEIFVSPEKLLAVWRMLLDVGKEYAVQPCGLAARDSLRAGAVLPLSHQDIGGWPFANNPWPFALADRGEDGRFSKEFVGDQALSAIQTCDHTLPFAGFDPRKMIISDNAYVMDDQNRKIGTILTCATDMAIGRVDGKIVSIATGDGKPENFVPRGLSCGFVKVNRKMAPGELAVLTDGKRKIKVEIRQDVRPDRTARRPIREMI